MAMQIAVLMVALDSNNDASRQFKRDAIETYKSEYCYYRAKYRQATNLACGGLSMASDGAAGGCGEARADAGSAAAPRRHLPPPQGCPMCVRKGQGVMAALLLVQAGLNRTNVTDSGSWAWDTNTTDYSGSWSQVRPQPPRPTDSRRPARVCWCRAWPG
jgi:hypothetical protein